MNTKYRRGGHNAPQTTLRTLPPYNGSNVTDISPPRDVESLIPPVSDLCALLPLLNVEGLLEILKIVELSEDH
jgi:hypothetical protein